MGVYDIRQRLLVLLNIVPNGRQRATPVPRGLDQDSGAALARNRRWGILAETGLPPQSRRRNAGDRGLAPNRWHDGAVSANLGVCHKPIDNAIRPIGRILITRPSVASFVGALTGRTARIDHHSCNRILRQLRPSEKACTLTTTSIRSGAIPADDSSFVQLPTFGADARDSFAACPPGQGLPSPSSSGEPAKFAHLWLRFLNFPAGPTEIGRRSVQPGFVRHAATPTAPPIVCRSGSWVRFARSLITLISANLAVRFVSRVSK